MVNKFDIAVADGLEPQAHDRRGSRATMTAIRREVRGNMDVTPFQGPDPLGSVGLAVASLGSIGLAAGLTAQVWQLGGILPALAAGVIALPLAARQQRVLELLVHDGSHGSFLGSRRLNDLLCDVLAAAPVMQSTRAYRRTHKIHHQQFGSDMDPCLHRMFIGSGCSGRFAKLLAVLRALPRYLADYYGGVASSGWRQTVAALGWHVCAVAALSLLFGAAGALVLWLLFWLLPFVTILPVLRMLAESDEHDYERGCEATGTNTNLGLVNALLVHPASDQYHLAHHAFAAVPIRRLRRFDAAARLASPLYAAMPIRRR